MLCLHGEPSWSYLYRHMIPVRRRRPPGDRARPRRLRPQRQAGESAPTTPTPRHVEWLRAALFDELDLSGITLVCQDWGGLLGLRLVAEHPERFARVVAANTFLPTGDRDPGDAFRAWRTFSQEVETFPTGVHRQRRLHHRPRARR